MIVSKSPDWLTLIYTAVRTCHSEMPPSELFKLSQTVSYEEKVRLVSACFKSHHLSVFEHASVTFSVEGVSRALLAQYSRHRIGVSLSVRSQRYVTDADSQFVLPATLAQNQSVRDWYTASEQLYQSLLNDGMPKEDARFVLPQAVATSMVTTLNLRSLSDLYAKRVLAKGAQWEIKDMVSRMAELVREAEPWTEVLF